VLPQAQVLHNVDPCRFSFRHLWRTILAATLVAYRAQRDLYVPAGAASSGIGSVVLIGLRKLWRPPGQAPDRGTYAEIVLLQIAAQVVLGFHRLRDFWRDHLRPWAL